MPSDNGSQPAPAPLVRSERRRSSRRAPERLGAFQLAQLAAQREVTLAEIKAAENRIRHYIRRTPVMLAHIPSLVTGRRVPIWMKLENLQVGEDAATRGVLNFVLGLPDEQRARGVVSAAWGGIGPALAYVGSRLGFPAFIFLSKRAAYPERLARLERWGARVFTRGARWTTIDAMARRFAEDAGMTYLDPFSDPAVIAGHGTIALEILEDIPHPSVMLVSGDRGGITLAGSALAVKETAPDVRVIGVEVDHIARLRHCLSAGRITDFPTTAGYVGPPRIARVTFDLVRSYVDDVVEVSDQERKNTARTLWTAVEVSAGPFGATAVSAALYGRVPTPPNASICAIVGASGEMGLSFGAF